MPRPRKVDLLPEAVRRELDERLRQSGFSGYKALSEWLAGQGYQISHAAIHDYGKKLKAYGEKMRQAREVASVWIGRLGAEPQGQVGQLVNEILRTLAFDLSLTLGEAELDPDDIPAAARTLKDLAVMMEKLERAANLNAEREAEIRRQTAEELAEKAEAAAGGGAIAPEKLRQLIREAYGVE